MDVEELLFELSTSVDRAVIPATCSPNRSDLGGNPPQSRCNGSLESLKPRFEVLRRRCDEKMAVVWHQHPAVEIDVLGDREGMQGVGELNATGVWGEDFPLAKAGEGDEAGAFFDVDAVKPLEVWMFLHGRQYEARN